MHLSIHPSNPCMHQSVRQSDLGPLSEGVGYVSASCGDVVILSEDAPVSISHILKRLFLPVSVVVLYLHITSYHIISYHIISYHIISHHITSYRFTSYHLVSYYIKVEPLVCAVSVNTVAMCIEEYMPTHAVRQPIKLEHTFSSFCFSLSRRCSSISFCVCVRRCSSRSS
jgi:hypothetical protein